MSTGRFLTRHPDINKANVVFGETTAKERIGYTKRYRVKKRNPKADTSQEAPSDRDKALIDYASTTVTLDSPSMGQPLVSTAASRADEGITLLHLLDPSALYSSWSASDPANYVWQRALDLQQQHRQTLFQPQVLLPPSPDLDGTFTTVPQMAMQQQQQHLAALTSHMPTGMSLLNNMNLESDFLEHPLLLKTMTTLLRRPTKISSCNGNISNTGAQYYVTCAEVWSRFPSNSLFRVYRSW